jgi:hypothetical protein
MIQSNLQISKNSAFRVWDSSTVCNPINRTYLMTLIECGHINIYHNNKQLTPFEGALWLDSLKITVVDGIVKINSMFDN